MRMLTFVICVFLFLGFFVPMEHMSIEINKGSMPIVLVPSSQQRAYAGGIDIDTPHLGDTWLYDGEMQMDIPDMGTIVGSGIVNLTMIGIEGIETDGKAHECIKIFFNGSFEVSGAGMSGNATLLGFMWIRISDLAWVRINLTTHYTVSYFGFPFVGWTGINTLMSPPLEHLDFPISVGEKWRTEYTATSTVDSSIGEPVVPQGTYIENYTCSEHLTDYSINGKTYEVYRISPIDPNTLIGDSYYTPSIKFYSILVMNFAGFPLTLTLKEYIPSDITAGLEVILNPDTANFGEEVSVTVNVVGTVGIGMVTVLIPEVSEEAVTINIVGGSGTTVITAPTARDNTTTNFDEGSFGVVAKGIVADDIYYGVATLTVVGPDIGVNIQPFAEDIIAGDRVTIAVDIINNGTADAEVFTVTLYIDYEIVDTSVVGFVEKGTTITIEFIWVPLLAKEYNIEVKANEDGNMYEAMLSNNTATMTLAVKDNTAPVIASTTPDHSSSVQLNEGNSIEFSVNATDYDGDFLNYTWYVIDNNNNTILTIINSTASFVFTANYTGQWSSDYGPYTVKCIVYDNRPVGVSKSAEVMWIVMVYNVNLPPVINEYFPIEDTITINEGENITLVVNVTDPDGSTLEYKWRSNRTVIGNGPSITITSSYTGEFSAGTYVINVSVSDGDTEIYHHWTLIVMDINRPPIIKSISPESNTIFQVGDSIQLSVMATDEDEDTLEYIWYDNGKQIGIGKTLDYIIQDPGIHNITVEVSDGKDVTTKSIIITVEKANGGGGGGEGTGSAISSGSEMLMPIVIIIVVLAVVIALVLIIKRKRD